MRHNRERVEEPDSEAQVAAQLTESTYRLYRLIVGESVPEWNTLVPDRRDEWHRIIMWYVTDLEALSGTPFLDVAAKLYARFTATKAEVTNIPPRELWAWQAIARFAAQCANDIPEDLEEEEQRWKVWADQRAPKIEAAPSAAS